MAGWHSWLSLDEDRDALRMTGASRIPGEAVADRQASVSSSARPLRAQAVQRLLAAGSATDVTH